MHQYDASAMMMRQHDSSKPGSEASLGRRLKIIGTYNLVESLVIGIEVIGEIYQQNIPFLKGF